MQSSTEPIRYSWESPAPGDTYLHVRVRRSTFIAVIGSLLVHVLLLVLAKQYLHIGDAPVQDIPDPLVVRLNPLMPTQAASSPPTEAHEPLPEPIHKPQIKPRANPAPKLPSGSVVAETRINPLVPATPPAPIPSPAPATDLLSYLNAARARRRAAEGISERDDTDAVVNERRPSDEEIRAANIKRNLTPGTNGVFQILSMSGHSATFSFRGWTTDQNNSRREVIEVEAGLNGNIERAVIRKMIELIRRYYKGDFHWESIQLGREVILSARPEDSAGLEDFMMREFFGPGTVVPAQ